MHLTSVVTRLRSTRHYGPLALYIISHLKQPACLIQEALSHQALDTAYRLLVLTCILHPESDLSKKMNLREADPDSPVPANSEIITCMRVSCGDNPSPS